MGFDPARVPPECLGLEIIRERARTAGASVAIDSQRGRGTYVVVTWEG
jgi:signal transduction histidine kinase